jgi:hypothetical protein
MKDTKRKINSRIKHIELFYEDYWVLVRCYCEALRRQVSVMCDVLLFRPAETPDSRRQDNIESECHYLRQARAVLFYTLKLDILKLGFVSVHRNAVWFY